MSTNARFVPGAGQDNTLRTRTQDLQQPSANQATLTVTTTAEETTVIESIVAAQTINANVPASGAPFLNDTLAIQVANSNPSALPAPVQSAATTATTGGTLPAATYYYKITAINANGETVGSNEVSVTTAGTTSSNTINWGAVAGATGYKIYRGTAAGAENVYYAVGVVTSYVDTNAASTAGTVPTYNTTSISTVVTFASNFQSAGTASIPGSKWGSFRFRFNGTFFIEENRAITI